MLKIEPSEITSFFYNNFFNFGGGGTFPVFPPGRPTAPDICNKFQVIVKLRKLLKISISLENFIISFDLIPNSEKIRNFAIITRSNLIKSSQLKSNPFG